MVRWLYYVNRPTEVVLAWQPPVTSKDRHRWAVGKLSDVAEGLELRYFRPEEFEQFNPGRRPGELLDLGYKGYPGFSPKSERHTSGVREAFMRRLPPRARPDFWAYMAHFRIPNDIELSDLSLLAITEAKLPGDGFSMVDEYLDADGPLDLMNEIAGYRHYASDLGQLPKIGDNLEIRPEPENPYDTNAVEFAREGEKIGNVNRLQAPSFLRWLKHSDVSGAVERINGTSDRPRLFAFVQVRPRV